MYACALGDVPLTGYSECWSLVISGKMLCNVQVNVEETPRYFHHENWSSTIHECMCSVTVNGIKGWGIAEYVYRYLKALMFETFSC